jgi:hypothetical protein
MNDFPTIVIPVGNGGTRGGRNEEISKKVPADWSSLNCPIPVETFPLTENGAKYPNATKALPLPPPSCVIPPPDDVHEALPKVVPQV